MIPWWAFLPACLGMFAAGHLAGHRLAKRAARMLWDKEMRDILEAVGKRLTYARLIAEVSA